MKIFGAYIFKSKDTVESEPPTGNYKVINIYVAPSTGKVVVEYDDTPQP